VKNLSVCVSVLLEKLHFKGKKILINIKSKSGDNFEGCHSKMCIISNYTTYVCVQYNHEKT